MSSEVIINENTFALEGGEEVLKKVILETCINIHKEAVPGAPADTGALRGSIMWRTPWSGDGGYESKEGNKPLTVHPRGLEGIVGSSMSYATYVEFGTRAHKISVNSSVKIKGRWVYLKTVNHPGTVAQPFMRKAADAVRGATAAEIGKKWGKEAMEAEFEKRQKKQRKV